MRDESNFIRRKHIAAFLLGTMANPTPEVLKELERLKQDADLDVQRFARESLRWLKKAKK